MIGVHPSTIYKYIYINRLNEGNLYQQLRHRGKRRTKYGLGRKHRIAGRVSIDHKPINMQANPILIESIFANLIALIG